MSTPGGYPEDEFDIAGRDRTPQGVHRQVRSPLTTLLPYLVVIVVVPLLAWGAVSLLGGTGGDTDPGGDATTDETGDVTEEPTEDPTEEPTEDETSEEPTEDPTEEETGLGGEVVLTTAIAVLNGTGVAGVAGEAQTDLAEAGFTSLWAGDYTASSPETTTLYYRNADLLPTAQAVGDILGITNLVEAASATRNSEISIVLRPDHL